MQGNALGCARCNTPFDLSRFTEYRAISCPKCRRVHDLYLYPAYIRETLPVAKGEAVLLESEASCFHHPDKRAVVSCENCGRFLCDLCRVEFEERKLCLSCFEVQRKEGGASKLQKRRIVWDNIAFALAVVPLLIWFITFITAPIVLYITIKYWKAGPTSIVPRSRIRYIFAFSIAILQLLGWGLLIVGLSIGGFANL